jgi:hypothetical protein
LSGSLPLLHDPPGHDRREPWFYKIPILGWQFAYARQVRIECELVNQAIDRGPVPESEWEGYTYDSSIRQTIEEIVVEHAYPKESTFHPLDPIELMFVLRYGDLNEVEILMEIEDRLGFKMDDTLVARVVEDRTTFIDFIRMVENDSASELHVPA